MELDTLGIVEQNEKYKYTDNELFIKNENYELAQEIQNEINNNNNTTLRLLETINFL